MFKLEIAGVDAIRAKPTQSVLSVLTQPKAIVVIEPCEGIHHLVIKLPYSSGLRLIEGQRLQVKMSFCPAVNPRRNGKGSRTRVSIHG